MRRFIALVSVFSLVSCQTIPTFSQYEAKPVKTHNYGAMVASANPMATKAGLEIIEKGGSAIDAAIAVQTVLTLVEPQSSGIGGGAFMVYYDAKTGNVTTYDGREKAPISANPDWFMQNGKPMKFFDAVKSGKSVGAPSVLAMLNMAWKDGGKLPWADGFKRAETIATDGYALTERTRKLIDELAKNTDPAPDVKSYFYDGAEIKPAGTIIKNPEYASTMREIAQTELQSFYHGRLAEAMVKKVAENPIPGGLTMADFAEVKPQKLEPLCQSYRVHKICGMAPPSSGGIGTLMIMGILENFNMPVMGNSTQGWHHFIEAQRLAYVDRDTYVADTAFVDVPIKGLLDKKYLRSRADMISPNKSIETANAGIPEGAKKRGKDATGGYGGTSHFVIVDKEGNVVSMTTSVEFIFGSQMMVGGFFLNNQLTDFSFAPNDANGTPIVNRVEAGKKPRSSMSPTIIFDKDGQFEMAIGSPGGNSIIAYVTKTIVAVLDWGMSLDEAIAQPNLIARKVPSNLEYKRMDEKIRLELEALGHTFTSSGNPEASGLHGIMVKNGKLIGAADPRREGTAEATK